jgi:hypothetical protein
MKIKILFFKFYINIKVHNVKLEYVVLFFIYEFLTSLSNKIYIIELVV